MTLSLVIGAVSRDLEDEALSALASRAVGGEKVVWLAPDGATARRWAPRLAHVATIDAQVTTLDRYVASLWAVWGDGTRFITPSIRAAFISEALEMHEGPLLSRLTSSNAVRRTAAAVALDGELESWAEDASAASRELRSVVAAYRVLANEAGFVEPSDAARVLATSGPLAQCLVVGPFAAFARWQVDFIISSSLRRDVTVPLRWTPEWRHRALLAHVERLRTHASEVRTLPDRSGTRSPEALAVRLWDGSPVDTGGTVRFIEVTGEEAEPVAVARAVKTELERGTRPDDIVVVHPEASDRSMAVAEAFAAHGIPFDSDIAVPLRGTPLGRTFLTVYGLCRGIGGREDAVSVLSSPFSGVSAAQVRAFDAAWRAQSLGDARALVRSLERDGGAVGEALRILSRPTSSSRAAWARNVEQAVSVLLAAGAHSGGRTGWEAHLDAATHSALVRMASDIAAIPDQLGGSTMVDVFADVVVATGSREGRAEVLLTEPERIRTRSFPVVFATGMSSDEFDAGMHDSFYRTVMTDASGSAIPDPAAERDLLFDSVATAATERLYLVRTCQSLEGDPWRASRYWDAAWDVCGRDENIESVSLARIEENSPVLDGSRVELRKEAAAGRLSPPRARRFELDEDAIGRLAAKERFTVTELEAYLACPYRWYYDFAIRPRELDKATDSRALGSLMHAALEATLRRVRDEMPERRVTRDNYAETAAIAAIEYGAEIGRRGIDRSTLEMRIALDRLGKRLLNSLALDTTLPPGLQVSKLEWGFGAETPFEFGGVPIVGKIDRIDEARSGLVVIDYKSGSVSGLKQLVSERKIQLAVYMDAARKHFDKPVQVALYRSLKSGRQRGIEVDGLSGADPLLPKNDRVGPAGLESLSASFEELAKQAASGIRSGVVDALPSARTCGYCSASVFCPKAVGGPSWR